MTKLVLIMLAQMDFWLSFSSNDDYSITLINYSDLREEWTSGSYILRQVTEVKLGRVRSNSGWVTSEA